MEIRQHETVGVVMSVDFFFFKFIFFYPACNLGNCQQVSFVIPQTLRCMHVFAQEHTSCIGRHGVSFFMTLWRTRVTTSGMISQPDHTEI